MSREIVIYADESVSRGEKFSNFYGGCLVESSVMAGVIERLQAKKTELNLLGEVKWQKITEDFRTKYESLMAAFFDEVKNGHVKVRVMFTQNRRDRTDLSNEKLSNGYFKLYYQFIKHAFGLPFAPWAATQTRVRLLFDEIPDQLAERIQFRAFLAGLSLRPEFRNANIRIDANQIAEVRSHDHVLLQCTDVVLGAMQFRLNERHREKLPNSGRRGKRTIAKERVYKKVLQHIRGLRPGFNIGITTGDDGSRANRWHQPYRHWRFESAAPSAE
jgi:hypothetical protein